jgi:hypothetical protein
LTGLGALSAGSGTSSANLHVVGALFAFGGAGVACLDARGRVGGFSDQEASPVLIADRRALKTEFRASVHAAHRLAFVGALAAGFSAGLAGFDALQDFICRGHFVSPGPRVLRQSSEDDGATSGGLQAVS